MPPTGQLYAGSDMATVTFGNASTFYVNLTSPTSNTGIRQYTLDDTSFIISPGISITRRTGSSIVEASKTFVWDFAPNTIETKKCRRLRSARMRAEERADRLLMQHLNREQRINWSKRGYFEFRANQKKYRISKGRVGNIEEIDTSGQLVKRYCCHVTDSAIPDSDNALAQMLMVKFREKEFLDMANVHYDRAIHLAA